MSKHVSFCTQFTILSLNVIIVTEVTSDDATEIFDFIHHTPAQPDRSKEGNTYSPPLSSPI